MKTERQRTALDDVRELLLQRAATKASAVFILMDALEKLAQERRVTKPRTNRETK